MGLLKTRYVDEQLDLCVSNIHYTVIYSRQTPFKALSSQTEINHMLCSHISVVLYQVVGMSLMEQLDLIPMAIFSRIILLVEQLDLLR